MGLFSPLFHLMEFAKIEDEIEELKEERHEDGRKALADAERITYLESRNDELQVAFDACEHTKEELKRLIEEKDTLHSEWMAKVGEELLEKDKKIEELGLIIFGWKETCKSVVPKLKIQELIKHRESERKNNNIFRLEADELNDDFIHDLEKLFGD